MERQSRRRTKAQFGFVNFPVDSETFKSTGEGGMFVKLVVIDDREYDETPWTICCGANVYDHHVENLVGEDLVPVPKDTPYPEGADGEQLLAIMNANDAAHRKWLERHYPNYYDDGGREDVKYTSRAYLAAMVIGITGWSGFHDEAEEYWHCTFDDLTEEGKALYRQLQALYPGCTLHLLTALDT